jgi:hypothetical protein
MLFSLSVTNSNVLVELALFGGVSSLFLPILPNRLPKAITLRFLRIALSKQLRSLLQCFKRFSGRKMLTLLPAEDFEGMGG